MNTTAAEALPQPIAFRYTCLVCFQRPVFDTVDMLTVHRKGKRHMEGEPLHLLYIFFCFQNANNLSSFLRFLLTLVCKFHHRSNRPNLKFALGYLSKLYLHTICLGLKRFYGKKTELKNEITKRKHSDYVQREDSGQVGDF